MHKIGDSTPKSAPSAIMTPRREREPTLIESTIGDERVARKVSALRKAGYRVSVETESRGELIVGDPDGRELPTSRLALYNGSVAQTLIRGACEVFSILPQSRYVAAGLLLVPPVLAIASFLVTGGSTLFVLIAGLSGAIWVLASVSGTQPMPERRYTLTADDRAAIEAAAAHR